MSDEDGMMEAADYYKRALDVAAVENERLKRALEQIGQRSLTFKHLGEPHCDTCLRPMKDCDGAVEADRCPGRIARRALTNTTPPPAAEACETCKGVKRWFDEMTSVYVGCPRCGAVNPRPAAAPPVALRGPTLGKCDKCGRDPVGLTSRNLCGVCASW